MLLVTLTVQIDGAQHWHDAQIGQHVNHIGAYSSRALRCPQQIRFRPSNWNSSYYSTPLAPYGEFDPSSSDYLAHS